MSSHALLHVMYGPCGYAHADHRLIGHLDLADLPASVANQLMIDRHGLDTAIDFDLRESQLIGHCVAHWSLLPRISYLIGAWRLRESLITRRLYGRLDPVTRRFLCLPIHAPSRQARMTVHDDASRGRTLVSVGTASLAAGLRHAPRAQRQRLPLLYGQAAALQFTRQLASPPDTLPDWHPTLFSFAVNYAILDTATAS